MGIIKTAQQIAKIKKASILLSQMKDLLVKEVKPGITTNYLDQLAHNYMKKHNVSPSFLGYYGYPKVLCTSVNGILIHGIPNDQKLIEGDLLSIDMGLAYHGYHADTAITVSVGKYNKENEKLITIAKEAFIAGINAIKPGCRTGDIGFAIEQVIKKYNVYVPKEFAGHGIGASLHEDPFILNYGQKGQGDLIKDNMVICIEPMIMQKSNKLEILEDGWTVKCLSGLKSSHYEHTILISNGKPIILTGGANE